MQIGHDSRRIVAQLPPGDPNHAPALDQQEPVLFAIPLEGAGGPMRRSSIELDGESLLRPKAVDLEEPIANREVNIALRPRQIRGGQKRREFGL